MQRSFPTVAALGLLVAGCRSPYGGTEGRTAPPGVIAEARGMVSAGNADGALAALQGHTDPEALTVQGRAWILKARKTSRETASNPSLVDAGSTDLRVEEGMALRLLEAAAGAQPDLADAHLAMAELLEPGALRWLAAEREAPPPNERRRTAVKPAPPEVEPTHGPMRVLQEYRKAAHADRASAPIVESWLRFALAAQKPEEAEVALQELLVRKPRDADPLLRYGDFLRDVRGDRSGALDRYREALIWQAGDERIKERIVSVFLDLAEQHLASQEYGAAEQRLRDVNRYAPFSDREVTRRFAALTQKLSSIRGR